MIAWKEKKGKWSEATSGRVARPYDHGLTENKGDLNSVQESHSDKGILLIAPWLISIIQPTTKQISRFQKQEKNQALQTR